MNTSSIAHTDSTLNVTLISALHSEYSTQDGWTPLMAASLGGHVDIVRILIEAKAQINTQREVCCSYHQKIHYTTHHHTQCHCNIAVLGELTVCLCPQDGVTALHMAAAEGKVDVVRLLTEAQAQVNIQTEVHPLCHV